LFLWWPKWPASVPFLASKGLFKSKNFFPPGSHSMSQGGLSSKCPETHPSRWSMRSLAEPPHPLAVSLAAPALARVHPQTGFLVAAVAVPQACACACPLSGPLAVVTRARVLLQRRQWHVKPMLCLSFCPGLQRLRFCGGGFLGHANELDAGGALGGGRCMFASNDAPPGSIAPTAVHSITFAPAFLAAWAGPRPTPPGSSRGSSHEPDGFKTSKCGLVERYMGAAPSPGVMPQVSSEGDKWKG
jgi:hypothetical protein